MQYVIQIGVGLVFTAFVALVFSVLTLVFAKLSDAFSVSGPDDWTFGQFYQRYLIVAAVFTFVTLPIRSAILGIAALAVADKFVFDAGWLQAAIMGIIGGTIAVVLFVFMLVAVLSAFV